MKEIVLTIFCSLVTFVNAQETKTYYDNGQLKEVGFFGKKRKKTGEWKKYYDNGNLESKIIFEKDIPNGMIYTYFKNGKPKEIISIIDGDRQGVWKEFYKNGNIKISGNYKRDKKTGEWSEFNEKGLLEGKIMYDSGKEINFSIIEYDVDGHIVKKWYKEWEYVENKKTQKMTLEESYQNGCLIESIISKNGVVNTNKTTTHLEMSKNTFKVGDAISVNFLVKNQTNAVFEFCYWQTPLEKEFKAHFFEIIYKGETLPYKGKMVKRKPPTKKDSITLKPNEVCTQTININNDYNLEKPGAYTIRFLGRTINGLPNSEFIHFILNPK